MIKLNNKNITYVALADSSNSLKAPKEIWYADSNNSVKLVYRRKDALIEGEDYEKYHWLKGDGDAEITHKDVNAFEVKILELDNTPVWYANGYTVNDTNLFAKLYVGPSTNVNDNYSGLVLRWKTSGVVANYRTPSLHIELGEHIITKNTQTDKIGVFTDGIRHIKNATSDRDYVGTDIIFNQLIPSQSLYIGYLSSPNIHNLIPCKLLKHVPKWLDANGIRRQVGECGMIDLVSGKFYGNVNSNGTFTVENYYERKNYLKCSDGSYMLYQNFDATSNIVNGNWVKFGTTEYLGEEYFLYGLIRTGWLCACYISENKLLLCNHIVSESYTSLWKYDLSTLNSHDNVAIQLKTEQVSSPTKYVSRSSIVFSDNYTLAPQNDNWFYNTVWGNTVCDLKISTPNGYILSDCNITQNNDNVISSLIPCTLTMDLPASMDANNISRTKGTSGMWDLVSDRFYGNVANSGTFKAVNLAEGVDYEVHQWLVATYPADTTFGTMCALPINSSDFSFRVIATSPNNISLLLATNYSYHLLNGIVNIYDRVNYRSVESINYSYPTTLQFVSNSTDLLINGQNLGQYGYPVLYYLIAKGSGQDYGYNFSTSSITVDGIERYIPVKLLKSIPSKYDANGIARQAGECGMYDTVNDVFYGNVASSGTFTVSD